MLSTIRHIFRVTAKSSFWPQFVSYPFSKSRSVRSDSLLSHGLYKDLPTQGSNPGLQHLRWIIYQLSHKGSPIILEWVPYPFSNGSSWPRNWSRVSHTAGGFFTNWAIKEALTAGNRPLFPLSFGGLPISNPLYHVPWPQRCAWDSSDLNLDLRLSEAKGSWGWITCW